MHNKQANVRISKTTQGYKVRVFVNGDLKKQANYQDRARAMRNAQDAKRKLTKAGYTTKISTKRAS